MQLGGSLMLTFTVPMPETMLLEVPPLQLTIIPAIAKIAATASNSVPARECRAIHSDFIALLLLEIVFKLIHSPEGDKGAGVFQALAGLAGTNESWALLTGRIIALSRPNGVPFKFTTPMTTYELPMSQPVRKTS